MPRLFPIVRKAVTAAVRLRLQDRDVESLRQRGSQTVCDHKVQLLIIKLTMASFQTFSITCECFSQKGDLELLTGVKYEDYEPLLDDVWQHFLDVNLRYALIQQKLPLEYLVICVLYIGQSFTVKNLQGRTVACGMNCDAFDVPKLNPRAKALGYVFEVLEHAKGPAR